MSPFTAEPMNATPPEEVLQKGERWLKSDEICWTTTAFLSLNEWYSVSVPAEPDPDWPGEAVTEYSPVQFLAAAVKEDTEHKRAILVRGKFRIPRVDYRVGGIVGWDEKWFPVEDIKKIIKTSEPEK